MTADADRTTASRFRDPRRARWDGLVHVGGELSPEWLLDAYRHGVFPWPSDETGPDEPMLWWSPDPRAVLPLDGMRVSRRLVRTIQSSRFQTTANRDFAGVMQGCATGPGRERGTWLTPVMRSAYQRMHELGHAHSVEAWRHDGAMRRLVGGVYGVAIGGVFAAESMFRYETDASKVALAALVSHLRTRGYTLLDIQQWTPHTGTLGAVELPRAEYLDRLATAVERPVTFGERLEGDGLG
ncbi:MAG: leucyl/phenylalanyl-tRNA--protein transferase [Planctomycetota bacterium]